MMKYLYLIVFIFAFTASLFSQISHGGKPHSFCNSQLKKVIDYRILPEIDIEQLMMEDAIDENDPDIPWRFGKDLPVDYNLENSGTWDELANGDRIWRLEIISYGAYSINLIYSKYHMPEGGNLFLYNENKTHVIGSFTSENHKPDGGFATVPVKGERCILEYFEPASERGKGELQISYVIHAYKDFYDNFDKGFGSSGACNVNANCPEGDNWQDQKRGVAMILTSNNARKCTGSMINNTAQDGTPYFLTADHCRGGENTWIIMFNYESPGCENVDGPTDQSVQFATLRATSGISDFCLIELSEVPPLEYNVFYNGWNKVDESSQQSICIHHPKGDIKKISFDYEPSVSDKYLGTQSVDGSHWKIEQWDVGTTEPGSSGSPLFNPLGQIVGQLHGGYASCTNLTADWFGKFAMSWDYGSQPNTRLMDWLDPLGTSPDFLNGFDPVANSYDLNANLLDVIQPEVLYGEPTDVAPKFVIRNMGNLALETLQISYRLDEGDLQTQTWSGFLNIYDTAQVSFPIISLDYGSHIITAFVDHPNGQIDEYPENDSITKNIEVVLTYDISVDNLIAPEGINCSEDDLVPKFFVKNVGFATINSAIAYITIDNELPLNFPLAGPINSGDSKYFVLDPINSDDQWHQFKLEVQISDMEDQNLSNNIAESEFNGYGEGIALLLTTDDEGEETSWEIKNSSGEILFSGNSYENNISIKEGFCLASDCYSFTIYDSGGNGIQNNQGFELRNISNNIELGSGTTFGESITIGFCVGNELSSQFTLANDTTCTNRDVFYINQSNAADYYTWYFEGGNPIASNEANPVVQYPNPGVYDVSLKAWQGQDYIETVKPDFITVLNCSGIEEVNNSFFSIFPNPSTGKFNLNITQPEQFNEIMIYNQMGEEIYRSYIDKGISNPMEINLESGLYIVELKSANLVSRQMLLITK